MVEDILSYILIKKISVEIIPAKNSVVPAKTFVLIQCNTIKHKTSLCKEYTYTPSWNEKITLSDLPSNKQITLNLFRQTPCRRKKLIGAAELAIYDIHHDIHEIRLDLTRTTSQAVVGSLTLVFDRKLDDVAAGFVGSSTLPYSLGKPDNMPSLDLISDSAQTGLDNLAIFLDSIEPFKDFFDKLSQFHPLASAAWSLLTIAYDVAQNHRQNEADLAKLREVMIHTFKLASKKDVLQEYEPLKELFNAMIVQTIECQIFTSRYLSRSYIGRIFQLNIGDKIKDFADAFTQLESRFRGEAIRLTAVVSTATHNCVTFLEREAILSKLHPHPQPSPPTPCLPGTRVSVLAELITWVSELNAEILWLTGLSGTGKSTIMSSLADAARRMGNRSRLGGYIRFNTKLMNDPSQCITTLAYKLAEFDDRISEAITEVIKGKSDIADWTLEAQMEELIIKPLQSVEALQEEGPILILIDSLDEAEFVPRRAELLQVLALGFRSQLPFMRLVIAARSQADISVAFDQKNHPNIKKFSLDNQVNKTHHDIQLYIQHRFKEIGDPEFEDLCQEVDAVKELTARACGLFIWAFTTVAFIWEYPTQRLLIVLGQSSADINPEHALDAIYRIALSSAVIGPGLNEDIKSDMRTILGAIMVAETPPGLDASTIDNLLFFSGRPRANHILRKLACVITFDNEGSSLRVLHKSFDDFLSNQKRSGDEWHVDETLQRRCILESCLRRLSRYFDSTPPFTAYPTPDLETIKIPSDIAYASKFWIKHYCKLGDGQSAVDEELQIFLERYFLRWLEIVSLVDYTLEAKNLFVELLEHTNEKECATKSRTLRYHAFQFLERFSDDIRADPALVYRSGLSFTFEDDMIRELHIDQCPIQSSRKGKNRMLSLSRHKGLVTCVKFYPSGSTIASSSWDGTILLIDASNGKPKLPALRGHRDRISQIDISFDGKMIASGSLDTTVAIWDGSTGALVGDFINGHTDAVWGVAFSHDARLIASCGHDKTVRVVEVKTRRLAFNPIMHDQGLMHVSFTPDDSKMISMGDQKKINFWNAKNGTALFDPLKLESISIGADFIPNSSVFATGVNEGIQFWDASTGHADGRQPFRDHEGLVATVSYSKDGSMLASGSWDQTIRIRDTANGSLVIEPILEPKNSVMSVSFSPDGTKLVSGGFDKLTRIWDISRIQQRYGLDASVKDKLLNLWDEMSRKVVRKPTMGMIECISISPDAKQFVLGTWAGFIHIYDVGSRKPLFPPILAHDNLVSSLAYSSNGSRIVSGSIDTTVRVWDSSTGSLLLTIQGHEGGVRCVAVSGDDVIASGAYDTTVRLWDLSSGQSMLGPFFGHEMLVTRVAFSPDGRRVVSASEDMTVRVWNTQTGTATLRPIRGHAGPVFSVAYSSDGKKIVTASGDHTIRIWNADTGLPESEPLRGHEGFVTQALFFDNDKKVGSTSADATIRIWDITKEKKPLQQTLEGHRAQVSGLAILPDQQTILSCAYDMSARIWDSKTGQKKAEPTSAGHPILAIALSADSSKVAAIENDGTVQIFDMMTCGSITPPFVGLDATSLTFTSSTDSEYLFIGSKDSSIQQWHINTGKALKLFKGHTDSVYALAVSSDDSMLLSGSSDQTIRLWDIRTGTILDTLRHQDEVLTVAFSRDDSKMLSGSMDGTIKIWHGARNPSLFLTLNINSVPLAVAFRKNDEEIIAGTLDGMISTWNIRNKVGNDIDSDDNLYHRKNIAKFPVNPGFSSLCITRGLLIANMQTVHQLVVFDIGHAVF